MLRKKRETFIALMIDSGRCNPKAVKPLSLKENNGFKAGASGDDRLEREQRLEARLKVKNKDRRKSDIAGGYYFGKKGYPQHNGVIIYRHI